MQFGSCGCDDVVHPTIPNLMKMLCIVSTEILHVAASHDPNPDRGAVNDKEVTPKVLKLGH